VTLNHDDITVNRLHPLNTSSPFFLNRGLQSSLLVEYSRGIMCGVFCIRGYPRKRKKEPTLSQVGSGVFMRHPVGKLPAEIS